jgi:uncharacterized SAM-binding protein YcdF (DUF218 family)
MTDAVVVLGAAMTAPGIPGAALRRRVEYGVTVFAATGARHLVVSGGVVRHPPAEAHMMRDLAIIHGVAADRIVVEDVSRNTFENAVYVGRIIRERRWRRVVVVTDRFHLARALYCFRRLGLLVDGEGVPRRPDHSRLAWIRLHAVEQARLLRSAALFRMGAHKPLVARVWGNSPASPDTD